MSHARGANSNGEFEKRLMQLMEFARNLGMPAPVHIGHGLFCCVAEITPQIAEQILVRHHIDNNRSKKKLSIGIFSNDMRSGRWRISHQGIAFNQNDLLFDGQNRLASCVRSGVAFVSKVTFNVAETAMINTDTGTSRSGVDAARILGITINDTKVTSRITATASVISRGPDHLKSSIEHQMDVLRVLREPLRFICDQFPSHIKRMTIGPVLGAIGRAYFHEKEDRLIELCNVMKNGYMEDPSGDSAGIVLSRFLQGANLAGGGNQSDAYFKAENAIHNFCRRVKITKLYAASGELYPLPIHIQEMLNRFSGSEE